MEEDKKPNPKILLLKKAIRTKMDREALHQSGVRITPFQVTSLSKNEVFVFGSNLRGAHAGGAARQALLSFGAVSGRAEGLQGQSYAIPTMVAPGGSVLTPAEIRPYVDQFVAFAQAHSELHFFVTEIGCGIAGGDPKEIGPLFKAAVSVENIWLPQRFHSVLMPG